MNQEQDTRTDAELVQLAQEDPESFGVLVYRYQERLSRYVRRLTYFSQDDNEDIIQEVFIKVYRNLNNYDERIQFSSWIYRITHNHVVDQIRRSNARPRTTSIDQNDLLKFMRSSVNIEKEVISKDCLEKAKGVIQALPSRYREVLMLRFLEEKEYEEIMDILQKPKGSVATLISRGRKLLLEELKKKDINCS